jgi:hypothetical protein
MKTKKQEKTIMTILDNKEDAGLSRLVTELSTLSNGLYPAMRRAHHDQPLPSRDVVIEIVEALRSVLFPGYFGFSDVKVESVLYHVAPPWIVSSTRSRSRSVAACVSPASRNHNARPSAMIRQATSRNLFSRGFLRFRSAWPRT